MTSKTETTQTVKSDRLDRLCGQALDRLGHIADLIRAIRTQDGASANAVAWLDAKCHRHSYEGAVWQLPLDDLFGELEEIEQQRQADEVFGPRE
jgi:hypothetical protein